MIGQMINIRQQSWPRTVCSHGCSWHGSLQCGPPSETLSAHAHRHARYAAVRAYHSLFQINKWLVYSIRRVKYIIYVNCDEDISSQLSPCLHSTRLAFHTCFSSRYLLQSRVFKNMNYSLVLNDMKWHITISVMFFY